MQEEIAHELCNAAKNAVCPFPTTVIQANHRRTTGNLWNPSSYMINGEMTNSSNIFDWLYETDPILEIRSFGNGPIYYETLSPVTIGKFTGIIRVCSGWVPKEGELLIRMTYKEFFNTCRDKSFMSIGVVKS
jgi:hypothetical protein